MRKIHLGIQCVWTWWVFTMEFKDLMDKDPHLFIKPTLYYKIESLPHPNIPLQCCYARYCICDSGNQISIENLFNFSLLGEKLLNLNSNPELYHTNLEMLLSYIFIEVEQISFMKISSTHHITNLSKLFAFDLFDIDMVLEYNSNIYTLKYSLIYSGHLLWSNTCKGNLKDYITFIILFYRDRQIFGSHKVIHQALDSDHEIIREGNDNDNIVDDGNEDGNDDDDDNGDMNGEENEINDNGNNSDNISDDDNDNYDDYDDDDYDDDYDDGYDDDDDYDNDDGYETNDDGYETNDDGYETNDDNDDGYETNDDDNDDSYETNDGDNGYETNDDDDNDDGYETNDDDSDDGYETNDDI